MKAPTKYTSPKGRSLLGQIWADAQVEDKLTLAEQNKALHRQWGKGRTKPKGKRYELLESIKTAEIVLGHGAVRLDHFAVREALADAGKENDWHFLYKLARWHQSERKPLKPDALALFIWRGWEECALSTGEWKGLHDLDDSGIALLAKAHKIANRAFKGGDLEGERAVTKRRNDLDLQRVQEPRFTYRNKDGKLILRRLAR